MAGFSRRKMMGGGVALAGVTAMGAVVSACGRRVPPAAVAAPNADGDPVELIDPKLAKQEGTLQWAVSGNWRSNVDKARDKYRHPIELLTFFEVEPDSQVIDMWPGAGYMTEILAPYLAHGKGRYTAALFESDAGKGAGATLDDVYRKHFGSDKSLYGDIRYTAFGAGSARLADPESADVVLMLLVIHDWMAAGIAEKAFIDAFQCLKPGGILGVEQHRADIGNVQDPAATNGYVQEPFVKQLASEAGFQFIAASEMNANPKDDKDHPFGVWTLPPQRLTAPRGQPPNPQFDGTLYESIGESDRMTLKFRKPQ
ncbi:MAG: class I SAM-dependent methyltransferase [Asticcacaulis sp.]